MLFEQPVNIYSQDYVLKRFQSNETAVQVVRGKLSALISESELIELQNSKATMYSKLASAVLDINSLQLQFSDISSKYDEKESGTVKLNMRFPLDKKSLYNPASCPSGE